jgi:hypothetical protein
LSFVRQPITKTAGQLYGKADETAKNSKTQSVSNRGDPKPEAYAPKNQWAARGENLLLISTNDDRKQKEIEEWKGSIGQKAKSGTPKPRRP